MNIEEFREYCLRKKGVTEEFPFDEVTLVFKVMGKMFALAGLENPELSVNLKAHPDVTEELREKYESVVPGYHMNKKHWNTVYFETEEISERDLRRLIDDSYNLVVQGLTKKLKEELDSL